MLGKLLKYDLKWTYKPLIVFYILAILFSITGRICTQVENSLILNIIGQICNGATIAMVINILINNFMRVWARFIRNIYKDESYLTHTLPVEKKTIYLSKILSAIIAMITSAIIIVICLIICYYTRETIEFLKTSIEFMANSYDSTVVSFIATVIIVLFLELLFALMAGYVGIIFGYKSNNMKILKSIVIGYMAFIIPSILTLTCIFITGLFNENVMNLFNTVNALDISAIKKVLYCGMAMYVVYIAIYYLIGKRQFEKGVNVE